MPTSPSDPPEPPLRRSKRRRAPLSTRSDTSNTGETPNNPPLPAKRARVEKSARELITEVTGAPAKKIKKEKEDEVLLPPMKKKRKSGQEVEKEKVVKAGPSKVKVEKEMQVQLEEEEEEELVEVKEECPGSGHSHTHHSPSTTINALIDPASSSWTKPIKDDQSTDGTAKKANGGKNKEPMKDIVKRLKAEMEAKAKANRSKVKKEKRVEPDGQVRPARFRDKCPISIQERVDRVMSQRMFMVNRRKIPGQVFLEEFKVLGSTGNVYTIRIGPKPSCDCPDAKNGNCPCKHILFVFLKVLKVSQKGNIAWYQKGLLTSELRDIFKGGPDTATGSHAISSQVRNAWLRSTGVDVPEEEEDKVGADGDEKDVGPKRLSSIGEDCPVCYEEMSEEDENGDKLIYDEALSGCGKPLHRECFNMWAATVKQRSESVTCVWCRTPWPVAGGAADVKGKGKATVGYSTLGYVNMADLVGLSRQRDTSSYYHGPMAGRRMNEQRYFDD